MTSGSTNGFLNHIREPDNKEVPQEIFQKFEKIQNGGKNKKAINKIKYLKRKKIFKRTYHLGRSKSGIGVLVSNKTIRNRVVTQSQLLKQTPIQDVRKFLIKKGFIKVGSNSRMMFSAKCMNQFL